MIHSVFEIQIELSIPYFYLLDMTTLDEGPFSLSEPITLARVMSVD